MRKFFGEIGYQVMEETAPGVWEEKITVRQYYGDWVRRKRRLDTTNEVNYSITIQNSLSIVADAFAFENFVDMRYVEFNGNKWQISDVELNYPRLELTIGGLYQDGNAN